MASIPCISVLRPTTSACPSLVRCDGEYLYPKILKELVAQGVFSTVLLSIAPDTPSRFIDVITGWGLDWEIGPCSAPHQRVSQTAARRNWTTVACISAYTQFFDKAFVEACVAAVEKGEADYAGAEEALSNLEFTVLGKRLLEFFDGIEGRIIVPSKPQAISKSVAGGYRRCDLDAPYTPSEFFVWMMQYSGEIGTMPADFITSFYRTHPREQWFERSVREAYTISSFAVPSISWIDELLQSRLLPHIPLEKLIGQLRWIDRFRDLFPASGENFVELGFGTLPLISYFACSRFRHVIANEPYDKLPDTLPDLQGLFTLLGPFFPYLEPPSSTEAAAARLTVTATPLEGLALAPDSVDFCISKMVFEHVEDVEALSKELHRVLKPGGTMVHEIGFNDHTGGTSSGIHFDFLRHSREEWTADWLGTNLWRLNDVLECWERIGFETEIVSKVVSANIPRAVHASWFGYRLEDLLCQTAVIRAVKRG